MDNEIKSFIKVWILAISSLTYCYFISFLIPKGKIRLLTLLPIVFFLTILPLNLTTVSLGGSTAFFLTWLANFKLLLFSFGHGPLSSSSSSSYPSISLPSFILIASLPIQIINNNQNPSPKTPQKPPKSSLNLSIKTLIFLLLILAYQQTQHIPTNIKLIYYCCCMYVGLELMLAMVAALARAILGLRLEPQFDEPYLATSLQDFWGRRWNLMVTNIMRPTVYEPIKGISKRSFGKKWAALPAVFATFLLSGLMHELVFFYLIRSRPTWEVTCFFMLQGICLVFEVAIKACLEGKWRLHRAVSGPTTVAFVMVSGFWLFFPQLQRSSVDDRISKEIATLLRFMNGSAHSVMSSIGISSLAGNVQVPPTF